MFVLCVFDYVDDVCKCVVGCRCVGDYFKWCVGIDYVVVCVFFGMLLLDG